MAEIPVPNKGASMLWCGGTMIPPGETRMIPEHHVPPHLRPAPVQVAAAPAVDRVLALLDGSVASVVEQLPYLDAAALARLKAAEAAGKTRKTLMQAIDEETLLRAHLAELRRQLETFDDLTLTNHLANLAPDSDERPVVEALMAERGIGRPGVYARLDQLDDQALIAHRATVLDNEDELGVVDELIELRGIQPPAAT